MQGWQVTSPLVGEVAPKARVRGLSARSLARHPLTLSLSREGRGDEDGGCIPGRIVGGIAGHPLAPCGGDGGAYDARGAALAQPERGVVETLRQDPPLGVASGFRCAKTGLRYSPPQGGRWQQPALRHQYGWFA